MTVVLFEDHYIDYKLQNIDLQYFEPNLTSHVQLLDGRIIHTETIANCWKHVDISPGDHKEWEDIFVDPDAPDDQSDAGSEDVQMLDIDQSDPRVLHWGWDIILAFAESKWTLPQVEDQMQGVLGLAYDPKDWQAGFDAVLNVEGDSAAALEAVKVLMSTSSSGKPASFQMQPEFAKNPELKMAENQLMDAMNALKECNCIKGDIPSIDDLLNPPIEHMDVDSEATDHFADGEKRLAQIVQKKNLGADDKKEEGSNDKEGKFHFDKEKALAAASFLASVCVN
ncbi:hypothetical protein GYMLUDRAFT_64840 [Collybiopsis luxurians FD-317 M1]|uniref:Uncharacterized protein n=1 Tax=Collybiopsis luxurians FD-317 M1 TaxID=944289 RepID=A0A0D0C998_9AGAR|nr:hypothetical protein GYMLUDRAFT_64840 [Collybiopsis luxurians FD-317 M1]